MVHRGEQVTAGLGAVREDGEGGRAGGTLGHEVRLDENLDGVLELQDVPEESARGAGLLPCREPVSLGNARPLEHVPVHLEVALLVGELEQAALLELVEGRVGRRRRDVVSGRQLGEVVVGELLGGTLDVAGTHRLVRQRLRRDGCALGEISLALAGLERDVALPRQVRGVSKAGFGSLRVIRSGAMVTSALSSGTVSRSEPGVNSRSMQIGVTLGGFGGADQGEPRGASGFVSPAIPRRIVEVGGVSRVEADRVARLGAAQID